MSTTKAAKKIPKRSPLKDKKLDDNKEKEESLTFTLKDVDTNTLDKNYLLSEISNKYGTIKTNNNENDVKINTTSLEKLGISNVKKEPIETIYWGDNYEIELFCNNVKLKPNVRVRCFNCHQLPIEGSLMLIVPYKYVPSYIEEHVFAPECVNIVKNLNSVKDENKDKKDKIKTKTDIKNTPKVNYFRKEVYSDETKQYENNSNFIKNDYFEGSELVCSFPCMLSRGRQLSLLDPRYRNVKQFISWMYKRIFGKLPDKLIEAPPFSVLEDYGGPIKLSQYRKDFLFISMTDTNQYFSNPKDIINLSSKIFICSKTNNTSTNTNTK